MPLSNKTLGLIGEYIAIIYILCKGYTILHHRYKTKTGEVDIIARHKKTIIFIEVKTRRNLSHLPLQDIITPNQVRRIHNSADWYRVKHKRYKEYSIRCDAIFIQPWKWPRHVVGIF